MKKILLSLIILLFVLPSLALGAITYGNQASASGTATTLPINAPAGGVNGLTLMVASVSVYYASSQPTITNPASWTTIGSDVVAGTYLVRRTAWKLWATGETSYTWTFSNASYDSGGIISFNGVNTARPIDVSNTGSGTSGTTVTVTTITTTEQAEMLVFFAGSYYTSARTFSAESVTGSSMAEVFDVNNRAGNSGSYFLWSGVGSTGSATATISGTITSWSGSLVAIRSAPTGLTSLGQNSSYNNIAQGVWSNSIAGGQGGPVAIKLATSSGSAPYVTSFPATENPISESSNWLNGLLDGKDWTNVRTLANTKAYGTQTGSGGYDDSLAFLKDRSYNNTQYAKGKLFWSATEAFSQEAELFLQGKFVNGSPNNAYGYELLFTLPTAGTCGGRIVKWLGAKGSFTYETSPFASWRWLNGEALKATLVNGIVSMYVENMLIAQWTDGSPYTGGVPGMGMYVPQAATNANFGWQSFEGGDQVENLNGNYIGNDTAAITASTPIDVTNGNSLIICCASYSHDPAVADLSKSAGSCSIGTIVRDKLVSGSVSVAIFRVPITGSGSCTIQFNPGTAYKGMSIAEFSGLDANPVGVTNSTTSGSGTNHTTGSMANTSGSLIVYCDSELSSSDLLRTYSDNLLAGSNSGGSEFTFGSQYKITSGTPNTLTSVWNESVNWWTCAVEYKAAAGGGGIGGLAVGSNYSASAGNTIPMVQSLAQASGITLTFQYTPGGGTVYNASFTLAQASSYSDGVFLISNPSLTFAQISGLVQSVQLLSAPSLSLVASSAFLDIGGSLFAVPISISAISAFAETPGTVISLSETFSQASNYFGATTGILKGSNSLAQASGYAASFYGTMVSSFTLPSTSGYANIGGSLFSSPLSLAQISAFSGATKSTISLAFSLPQASSLSDAIVGSTYTGQTSFPQVAAFSDMGFGAFKSSASLPQISGISWLGGNIFNSAFTLGNASGVALSKSYSAGVSLSFSPNSSLVSSTAMVARNLAGISAVSNYQARPGGTVWMLALALGSASSDAYNVGFSYVMSQVMSAKSMLDAKGDDWRAAFNAVILLMASEYRGITKDIETRFIPLSPEMRILKVMGP